MVATRSIRTSGQPALGSGAQKRADLNGTWCTEPIKASGHSGPRKQAGHMTALDHSIANQKHLAFNGPSTHDPMRFPFRGTGITCC